MKDKSTQFWFLFFPVVFSLLLLTQLVYSQSQPQEIARYEGKINSSEFVIHKGKTYSGLCPQEIPAELVLYSDGTLVLSYTHHKISLHMTETSVTCSVSTEDNNSAGIEIRGTHIPNANMLTFASVWVNSANGWIQLKEATGNGDFNSSSARGQLVYVVFGAETHITFDMPAVAAAAPPAPKGCNPQPRGLNPLKPGDVISPGADYFDDEGKATGIIQERWYFNGTQGASIIWDGNPVQVELQWTCLDHSGHSKVFVIPAYQEPAREETQIPEPPPTQKRTSPKITIKMPTSTAILIAAVTLGVIGLITRTIINGVKRILKPKPKLELAGQEALTSPAASQPQTPTEASPSAPESAKKPGKPSTPKNGGKSASGSQQDIGKSKSGEAKGCSIQTEKQTTPKTSSPTSSPQQRIELGNIRSEMQAELESLTEKYNQIRQARETLRNLKKKNMLKFIMKKGLDVSQWVTNSPVEVINNVSIDPAMEKVFEKHDTSKDGAIIVQINNRIEKLGEEMRQIEREAKYLKNEIKKIDQKIGQ